MAIDTDVTLMSDSPPGTPVRVLLVCREPKRRRALLTAMHGAADVVDVIDSLDAPFETSGYGAIVIDEDSSMRQPPASLLAVTRLPPVVVLVTAMRDVELLPWFEGVEAVHVLQSENLQRFNDLHVTLRKLTSGDIFGIEKYFAWSAREQMFVVQSSDEKPCIVEAVSAFSEQIGVQGRMRTLAATVVDEFLTNALYNAPVDQLGVHRFKGRSRAEPVYLGAGEAIVVKFCGDGRRLGISVTDPFGSLAPENVRSTLVRGLSRGAQVWDRSDCGGAGLGFYCAFSSLSHLVVNIEPGRRTEIIGILALRDSYRDFLISGKSFDVFESSRPMPISDSEVSS